MKVNIWGCRGSIARSHPSLIKYGGNTPCVEVIVEADAEDGSSKETRIVLDMGSGAYDLGQKLVKLGPLKDQNILLTHCHWDHIQGFPFFAPLFIPGSHWRVYAPGGFTSSLKEKLASQMSYEFFPLSIDMLGATIDYNDLTEGQFMMGDVQVSCQYLNHTVLTLGYRLEAPNGTSMAYITDHEPFNQAFAVDGYTRNNSVNPNDGSSVTPDNGDDRHVEFLKDVELLIHDSQYTAEEYKSKVGWGHGTIEYVVDVAMAAGVKKLVLFHHDPQRTDDQVEDLLQMAKDRAEKACSKLQIFAAADRAEIYLEPKKGVEINKRASDPLMDASTVSAFTKPEEKADQHVFICHSKEGLFTGCKEDGAKAMVVEEDNGSGWSKIFETGCEEQPTMFVISCDAKYQESENGVQLCKRIRDMRCENVPIFLVAKTNADMEKYKEQAEEVGAEVTDWIVEPLTPAYIRTRIRMGMSRNPCRWIRPEIPVSEPNRLATIRSMHLEETKEPRFDSIVNLAKNVLQVDGCALNIVEENYYWSKSYAFPLLDSMFNGMCAPRCPRDVSFCGHAILQKDIMVVNDMLKDHRFADNPQVVSGMKARFYAGCPISIPSPDGSTEYNIGTLCLVHMKPRKLDEHQTELLRQFASLIRRELLLTMGSSAPPPALITSAQVPPSVDVVDVDEVSVYTNTIDVDEVFKFIFANSVEC